MPIFLEPGHMPLDHIPILLHLMSITIYSLVFNLFFWIFE